eukprot:5077798-Amphidinium_carterae.1
MERGRISSQPSPAFDREASALPCDSHLHQRCHIEIPMSLQGEANKTCELRQPIKSKTQACSKETKEKVFRP